MSEETNTNERKLRKETTEEKKRSCSERWKEGGQQRKGEWGKIERKKGNERVVP